MSFELGNNFSKLILLGFTLKMWFEKILKTTLCLNIKNSPSFYRLTTNKYVQVMVFTHSSLKMSSLPL